MTTQMILCLGIFLFMIGGYVFGDKFGLPSGIIALCTIVLTMFSGIIKPGDVIANFGNSNVILIAGMYIVAAGFNRTQAVNKLSSLVYKVSGGNFTVMLAGYCGMAFLLGQFIPSPVAVFTLLAPLVTAGCADFGVKPSKAMFPVLLVTVGCCGVLPVGSGATTFAVQNGYLEAYGYTGPYTMQLLDPLKGRGPAAFALFLYAVFIAPKLAPAEPSVAIAAVEGRKGKQEQPPLDPVHEVLGYAIFIGTTVMLIAASYVNLQPFQVTMAGAALMMVTGVLKPREGIANIPVRIILLIVAALSAGAAMMECGLGQLIGDTIAGALGGTRNGYVIGLVFFVIPFILTQFMQNGSVSNIFRPIVILTCTSLGCNPIGPLLLLNASTLTAFLTPMATPAVPVCMEAGGYNQTDLLKQGWLPCIIVPVISVLWIMTAFPAFP